MKRAPATVTGSAGSAAATLAALPVMTLAPARRRPRAGLRWLTGITLLVAALLVAGQIHPYLGDYGDDAEFLVLGQGLANGYGYAWANNPPSTDGTRPAHNRYPPAYPALLAAIMLATRTNADAGAAIVPAKLVTAATLFAALVPLWVLARRRLPPAWAALSLALFAVNPFVVRFAVQVMSDVPYVFVFLLALAWVDRLSAPASPASPGAAVSEIVLEGRSSRAAARRKTNDDPAFILRLASCVLRRNHRQAGYLAGALAERAAPRARGVAAGRAAWEWIVLGLLLALGVYVRSVGLAAAAGLFAWLAWRYGRVPRNERRPALLAPVIFVLAMLPWWVRDASLAGGWRYLEEFLAAQYLDPGAGTIGSAGLLARAAGNAGFLLGKPAVFGPAGILIAIAAAVVLVLGFFRSIRSAGGAVEWAVICVVLAVLIWPIKTGRYVLPVVPVLGIYAIAGARTLAVSLGAWRWRWPAVAVAIGVAAFALFEVAYAGREAAANVRRLQDGRGPAAYYRDRPDWAHYLAAAAWLRQNAGTSDVAMARRHFALYVYSGRFAEKYRFDTSEEELAYLLSGNARKFVVEDAFDVLRGDFAPLLGALRARGGDLVLRYETPDPAVRVWELVRPPR